MAQPRLVPRQRMINMMYLVLTALLALNVSKETLDVIAKVDKSLNQTIDNFTAKNNLTYAAFDNAYALNPVKAGPWKTKADAVKTETQKLIDKITQYKWEIVREADGKDARLDSIKRQDQLNVPAQIMLVETIEVDGKRVPRATDLRNSIGKYRQFLESQVDKDTSLFQALEKSLAIIDPHGTAREPSRTWEQDNFEYLPLIGVIALMSKMQSDVRNAESDVLNYLYSSIDVESYKFNKLRAVVIPKTSNVVFQGNPYEAEIFLAAFDTTMDPEILIGGRPLEIRDGRGIFRAGAAQVGNFTWGGVINYTAPDGTIKRYNFDSKYEVAPPSLVVSPTKMNVFYRGLDNPVEISVPGVPASKISAVMTNGVLHQVGPGKFIANPSTDQGIAMVSVTAEVDGVKKPMGERPFRLFRVPPPQAKVGGQAGGKMRKNDLMAQTGVMAELEGFLFDMKFTVRGFKVTVISGGAGGYVKDEVATSARFTDRQKTLIGSAAQNARIIIEDIVAVGEDKIERTLPSITFTIQ